MGSLTRRLSKALKFRSAGRKPAAAIAMSEGFALSRRLERAAKDARAPDPMHFLEYLKQMRRGYAPGVDGPSYLMTLVDDILDFEKREGKRLEAQAKREAN